MIMAVRRVRVRLCSTAVYYIVKSKRGDSFIVELGYLRILQRWCDRSFTCFKLGTRNSCWITNIPSELKITINIQS